MAEVKKAFTEFEVNSLKIPNRIMMSPMVTHYATDHGAVTDKVIEYYRARAKGGVGIIMVETTFVELRSHEYRMLGLYDDKFIPGMKKLVDAIHAEGAKAAIQLNHKGRLASQKMTFKRLVSASNEPEMGSTPRAMTIPEIKDMIDHFVQAARRAKEAGFDAVELHMAHGYLINQFLSPYSNHRTDEYGGSWENRAKFGLEIIRGVREVVGKDYPIMAKIGATDHVVSGVEVEDWEFLMPWLEEAGIDAVTVSGAISESTHLMTAPMAVERCFNVENAKKIKGYAKKAKVGTVGRIMEMPVAEKILVEDDLDFIAIGRPLLADPDFVNKAKEGRLEDIRPCISCNQGCVQRVYEDVDIACLANPVAGREDDPHCVLHKVATPKTVLVIGGGPAGLSAAATAAKRGHKVTLFEAGDHLGGQFHLAGIPPLKKEIPRLVEFLGHDARSNGVEILLNKKATAKDIEERKPDAVIIATGGTPVKFPFPGIERCKMAEDVLLDKVKVNSPCVVIGGGSVGCETADYLEDQGVDTIILEMMDDFCKDQEHRQRKLQLQRLIYAGARMMQKAKVLSIGEDYVEYECLGLVQRIVDVKDVVMAVGYKANVQQELIDTCKNLNIPCVSVGDCKDRARNALPAIREGFDAGLAV